MNLRTALTAAIVAIAAAGAGCVGPGGAPGPGPTGQGQQSLDFCPISPDGTLCNNGDPCIMVARCMSGVCVPMTPAPDGSPCTGTMCTMNNKCKSGVCVGTPAADGYPCVTGEPCTDPGSCMTGLCRPGPIKTCNDNNPCTTDSCVMGKGCMSVMIPECTVPDAAAEVRDAASDEAGDLGDVATDAISMDRPPMDLMPIDMPPVDVTQPDIAPVDMGPVDRPPVDTGPGESVVDLGGGDMSMPEVGDVGSTGEAGDQSMDSEGGSVEVSADVASDAPIDGVPPVDGPRPDAAADLAGDTSDDSAEPGPDLRARGGACVCSADGARGPEGWLAGLLMALICLGRRSSRRSVVRRG